MTAQVPDTVDVVGVQYSIAGISGTGLFDPVAHGVASPPISTGCWRGYVCHYAVVGDAFLLRELRVSAGATVNGVPVAEGAALLDVTAGATGGEAVFRYDALGVPFTGTLLAGHGFVRDTYVHMGFQPAWRWEHVIELTVDRGRVTAQRDKSAEMAAIRERVLADSATDPDGDRADPRGWVARTFRLGYDRTYGDRPRPPAP